MSVSSKAEGEASQKGLTGAAKRQYVGGAINRAKHEKAASATPAARSKQQQHSYQREAVADARSQIRYHEAQITGLREGLKLRRELVGPAKKRTPKPKAPPTIEQQIERAGGYVPKTPADKLRKLPVREMTDAQLMRDWENHPPERRRGVLEREMARRRAKAEKAQQPKKAKRSVLEPPELKPIRSMEGEFRDPSAPVDPKYLRDLYGGAQLHAALDRYTTARLRDSLQRTGQPSTGDKETLIRRLMARAGVEQPKAAKPSAKPAAKPAARELIPVGRVDPAALDPYQPPNPHALRQLYGDDQLREALNRYSFDALKKSTAAHGGDPKASSKRVLVDRLMAEAQAEKAQQPKAAKPRAKPAAMAQGATKVVREPAPPAGSRKPMASVRSYTYHGKPGFLITGRSGFNHRYSIFSESREEAERMRDDIKAGREPQFDAFRK